MPHLQKRRNPRSGAGSGSTAGVQGRQDSNLQPPVLETGALPIAPRPWVAPGLYRRRSGIIGRVTTIEEDGPDEEDGPEDDLLEEQEHKGYGEDEGEREDALEELDDDDEQ
jgi:hypothetical protein